jgi:hypothetical protein
VPLAGRCFLIVVLLLLGNCAVPIRIADVNRDIPRTAVPAVARASLDTLSDPEIQRRMQRLLADPQTRAVQQALVAGLLDGALASLSDTARAERIGALATQAMTGLVRELSADLAEGTSSVLTAAMAPAHQRELEKLVGALVAAAFRSAAQGLQDAEMGKQLAGALTGQIGPALRQALRDEVAPGLAEALENPELNKALGKTARTLGREMVLGATEALAQTQPRADGSLLARGTELAHQGARLVGSTAWLLLLIIVARGRWSWKQRAQARSYREEAERRAATSHFVAEATKVAAGKPWSDELLGALQERLRAEEEAIAALRFVKRPRSAERPRGPPRGAVAQRARLCWGKVSQ